MNQLRHEADSTCYPDERGIFFFFGCIEIAMSSVVIEILRSARDARGYVFQPMDGSELGGYGNVHVVYSIPGAVRGNHYHLAGTEVCSLAGPALVRYREAGQVKTHLVPEAEIWRFTFPAGVSHAIRNEGTQPMLLVSFNTEAHDPAQPDVVRDVLIE